MGVKIGGRQLIDEVSILVPKNEDSWIEIDILGWTMRIHVEFHDEREFPNQKFNFTGFDDHGKLTITNWNTAIPAGSSEPLLIAYKDKRPIFLLISGYVAGELRKVDLFFLWGEEGGAN